MHGGVEAEVKQIVIQLVTLLCGVVGSPLIDERRDLFAAPVGRFRKALSLNTADELLELLGGRERDAKPYCGRNMTIGASRALDRPSL